MCTAFSIRSKNHYFGRNLDLDHHYSETITITPKGFHFPFRHVKASGKHYAIIGIATVMDGIPLYYDAINDQGLCIAGLNFPGNAVYQPVDKNRTNIASFELIPWILTQCQNVTEAKTLLLNINLCDTQFRKDIPTTPLHWIISDSCQSISVEPVITGLKVTDNPIGILTNNPVFEYHMHNLTNFMHLSPTAPSNNLSKNLQLQPYSLGMGAIGLPGDFSSASRFIRCAFMKENANFNDTEENCVSQVFHILDGVSQLDGCVKTPIGYEKTLYSICCNATNGIFYYTTYSNRQITAIDMHKEDLNSKAPISYPLLTCQEINWQQETQR